MIWKGKRIPYMRPGSVMGPKKGNILIACANAFMNLRFGKGVANSFDLSEQNSVITIEDPNAGAQGTSSASTGWNWADPIPWSTTTYDIGEVVYVDSSTVAAIEAFDVHCVAGLYVSIQPITSSDSSQFPTWPPNNESITDSSNYWWLVSPRISNKFLGMADFVFPTGRTLFVFDGDIVVFPFYETATPSNKYAFPFYHTGNSNETSLTVPTPADLDFVFTNITGSNWLCSAYSLRPGITSADLSYGEGP